MSLRVQCCSQIRHYNWEEDNGYTGWSGCRYYSNYQHIINPQVTENQWVSKGDIVAYSQGTTTFDHLHFAIRMRYNKPDARNPWKYLPNDANDYSSFDVNVTLTPNYNGINCQAVVNVSVPPDQLTFNRVELHIKDSGGNVKPVRFYDMEGANSNHTFAQMDNHVYTCDGDGVQCSPDDYEIIVSIPRRFSSASYANNEDAVYGFEFIDLPAGGGQVMATVVDVFDNSESTTWQSFTC